jgi:hypothetical protein
MSTTAAESGTALALVQGEPIAMRATRVLLAWLSDTEAVSQILGRNPMPQDDLGPIRAQLARARLAVRARATFTPCNPVIDADRKVLDQIAVRPELRAAIPDAPWTVEWIDLTRILSLQKLICTDGLDLRIDAVKDDPAAIADFCLPAAQPVPPLGAFTDTDGTGITISSLNPNLCVVGAHVQETLITTTQDAPPQKMQAVTFFVNMGTSYLQIAHYRGRYFLRDGYHRAVGLLRAGVTRVPAILIQAPTFQYVAPAAGLFDHEVAFGDRPPQLADFWDDSVSADATQPAVGKVIRIKADQFPVQG